MAAHNAADSVGAAMDSIIFQSFTDWMLIVVDDGSTDETFEVLSAYASKDPRIKLIQQPKNEGLAYSLNAGIAQTRSELIARMDADDRSMSNRLCAQLHFMNERSDVDVI